MRWRTLGQFLVIGLACHGLVQLVDSACYVVRSSPWPAPARTKVGMPLLRSQQPLVSALARVLDEDGCPAAERWAAAIVRASPITPFAQVTASGFDRSSSVDWVVSFTLWNV